jgi:hypothetical protein
MSLGLRLSAASLRNIPVQDASDPFTFIADRHRFPSHVMNATFLSPRLAQARAADATLSEYQIMASVSSQSLEEFLSLADGSSVPITVSNCIAFLQLGEELNNPEICSFILGHATAILEENLFASSDLTVSTVLGRFWLRRGLLVDSSEEVQFIASNLSQFPLDEIRSLPIDVLGSILSNESLKIESEDWLCNWLLELGTGCFSLFEFVHFEFLSSSTAAKFAETCESCLSYLNLNIWKAISVRFIRPIAPRVSFAATTSEALNGIIRFLQQKCKGTPELGFSVSSSSVNTGPGFAKGSYQPEEAVDFENPSVYFVSQNQANQWWQIDFRSARVIRSSYTLRTHNLGPKYAHLKQWACEGSLDGSTWNTLDQRTDDSHLNDVSRCLNYNIAGAPQ